MMSAAKKVYCVGFIIFDKNTSRDFSFKRFARNIMSKRRNEPIAIILETKWIARIKSYMASLLFFTCFILYDILIVTMGYK
jgi:hypothetical protein